MCARCLGSMLVGSAMLCPGILQYDCRMLGIGRVHPYDFGIDGVVGMRLRKAQGGCIG